MNVSVMLRLLSEPLAAGRLVGQVEIVETGERTTFPDAAGLVSYLSAHAAHGSSLVLRAAPGAAPEKPSTA